MAADHRIKHLQVVKTTTAVTVCGSLFVLSGVILVATVAGVVVATPVLVMFSPVLVPALIAVSLIFAGFMSSGGLGAVGAFLFYWLYCHHKMSTMKLTRS